MYSFTNKIIPSSFLGLLFLVSCIQETKQVDQPSQIDIERHKKEKLLKEAEEKPKVVERDFVGTFTGTSSPRYFFEGSLDRIFPDKTPFGARYQDTIVWVLKTRELEEARTGQNLTFQEEINPYPFANFFVKMALMEPGYQGEYHFLSKYKFKVDWYGEEITAEGFQKRMLKSAKKNGEKWTTINKKDYKASAKPRKFE